MNLPSGRDPTPGAWYTHPVMMMSARSSRRSVRFWATSYVTLCVMLSLLGCESPGPTSGTGRLTDQPSLGCRQQDRGVIRATKHPAASTQPAIAKIRDRHVLAWIDDREFPHAIYMQTVDPLGQPQGQPRRLDHSGRPDHPRLASSNDDIALVFNDLSGEDEGELKLLLFDHELNPLIEAPRSLTQAGASNGASIIWQEDHYLVGIFSQEQLQLYQVTVRQNEATPTDAEAGPVIDADAAAAPDRASLQIEESQRSFDPEMVAAGNIDLLYHDGRTLIATDTPEGWSIQIGVVGDDSVTKLAQVIDDRRHPELVWSQPSLGPLSNGRIALLWQGPGAAISSLYLLGFDREGHPMGQSLIFEGRIVDDTRGQVVGRAPVFYPDLVETSYGLLVAFSDNRYSNSEILLAPFSCGE